MLTLESTSGTNTSTSWNFHRTMLNMDNSHGHIADLIIIAQHMNTDDLRVALIFINSSL